MTTFPNLHLIQHPLILRDLTILRDKNTPNNLFRHVLQRLTKLMAYEVLKDLTLKEVETVTPLEKAPGHKLIDEIILVPILRAGLGMIESFLDLVPEAKVGHVGLFRDEETLQPVDYYSKFPERLDNSIIFLLDPMLATGGSASAAISFIKEKKGENIRLVTLVAAPEGVEKIQNDHPEVIIYSVALDRQLNQSGYILPGLGDAGDRIFGTDG